MATIPFPDYEKPPVVEVAIALQFDAIQELTAAHAGLYWKTIRSKFGRVEEQAPIPPLTDPSSWEGGGPPSFFTFGKPPMPRLWFIDGTSTRIIQVQRDKFIHNWRKMAAGDEYPRFTRIRGDFLTHWDGFLRFLAENRLPSPNINQCELTYVNRIKKGEGWMSMADIEGVFATFVWKTRYGYLPAPHRVQWAFDFAFPGQPGRLHVEMVPVRSPPHESEQAIQLVLTARGIPTGATDPKSVNAWFDIAHEWIVKGFADLVDKRTDSLWGKLP
jgi:uncharacterized protein (TIGR04255 family)